MPVTLRRWSLPAKFEALHTSAQHASTSTTPVFEEPGKLPRNNAVFLGRGLVWLRLHDDLQPGARRGVHEGVFDLVERESVGHDGQRVHSTLFD